MKRMLVLAVVALFVGACGYPVQGPIGPKGDPGLQGPQATVPAVVWKNSVGSVIAYGAAAPPPPMHRDGNGHWWFVNTDSGNVDLNAQPTSHVVFTSTNCTGPNFYLGPIVLAASLPRSPFFPPRMPFFVAAENQWRVRDDDTKAQLLSFLSERLVDGSCATTNLPNLPAIPTGPASSITTVMPDLGGTGPLHPETFQD